MSDVRMLAERDLGYHLEKAVSAALLYGCCSTIMTDR